MSRLDNFIHVLQKYFVGTIDEKTTTNAVKILHKRYIKGNKKRLESLQRERENLNTERTDEPTG